MDDTQDIEFEKGTVDPETSAEASADPTLGAPEKSTQTAIGRAAESERPADLSRPASDDAHAPQEGVFEITPDLNISPVSDTPQPRQGQLNVPVAPPSSVTPMPVPAGPSQASIQMPQQPKLQDVVGSILPENLRPREQQPPLAPNSAAPTNTDSARPPMKKIDAPIDPNLKALRTYEGDVAEVMAHQNTSQASMVIAENQKKGGEASIGNRETPGASHGGRRAFEILVSLVFIAGGVIGAYYLYGLSPLAANTPVIMQTTQSSSLVPADSQAVIAIDGLQPDAIIARVREESAKSQSPGTIKNIVLTETQSGQIGPISAPNMLDIMDLSVPAPLSRTITAPWMLGVYADASGDKSIFVVATTNFFQDAFAGMLQWESVMPDDLKGFLYQSPPKGIANLASSSISALVVSTKNATTTVNASSTANFASTSVQQTLAPYPTLQGTFQDRIIDNKDVREFVTSDHTILFLYSFLDNSHIVVTNSEAALTEILNRLEKQAFMK